MRLLPALLLFLALNVTAAPLPFLRTHPALKALEGEWALSSISVRVEDVGEGLTGRGEIAGLLTVSVKGDRLRVYSSGRPEREWGMAPRPEKDGTGLGLILTRRARGVTDGTGFFQPGEDRLLIRLVAEDAGLTASSDPPKRKKVPVWLILTRRVRR